MSHVSHGFRYSSMMMKSFLFLVCKNFFATSLDSGDSPNILRQATITRCDLSARFFCIDAKLLCEFESDKIWINEFE